MNVLRNYKAVWIMAFTAAGLWSHVGFSPNHQDSPYVERNLAAIDEAEFDQIDIDLTMGKIEAAEYNQKLEKQSQLQDHLARIKELSAISELAKKSIERTQVEKEHLTSLIEKESFSEEEVIEINKSIALIEEDFNKSSQELVDLEEQIKIEMDRVAQLFNSFEKMKAQEGLSDLENKLKELQDNNSKLEEELGVVGKSVEAKDADLEKLKLKNADLIKAENEVKKNLCEQQQKTADLESEMSKLLEDKEVVTAKILSLADKKEDLLKDIDDLKDYVKPKKEKAAPVQNTPVAANDIAALLAAITNLTQQLQLSQQFQGPQQMFGASAWNSWSNMGGFMMMQQQQQQQIMAPAWMNGIGGESLSGNPGYNPMGVNRQFINQNTFQMERPYGSDLLDNKQQQPQFDFGTVRRSFQPDHSLQARDVSSVFFDFTQQ